MMLKQGFSLIEIMVALLITSLMSISLYQLVRTSGNAVERIRTIIDVDQPLMIFYKQLERDMTGIFVPQDKKTAGDSFIITHKQGALYISCITTAGLQTVDSKGKIQPMPFIRRVSYELVKDTKDPDLYHVIYKQESESLSLETLEQQRGYSILTVKSLSVSCTVFEQQRNGQPLKKPVEVPLTQWSPKEIYQQYTTYIPAFITFSGIVVSKNKNYEQKFTFKFPIPAYKLADEPPKTPDTATPLPVKKEGNP